MKSWQRRPIEEANLFNPAFCGELLKRAIAFHNKNCKIKFQYPLAFLILPIVLHRNTRELISPKTRDQLHVWMQSNQIVRINFAERTKSLIPITNEALNFLFQTKNLAVDDMAGLSLIRGIRLISDNQWDEETRDCYRKAEIVGRWFARAGNAENIYTMWGVKP